MIVKPSISFLTNDSDALLITATGSIITAMTGNTNYATPLPTLAVVQTAWDAFIAALADAASGGLTLTAIKNDKRAELVAWLRQLASYVQVTCKGDLTILLSSAFPIQKPQRFPIGVLPAPTGLTITLGSRTGRVERQRGAYAGRGHLQLAGDVCHAADGGGAVVPDDGGEQYL